MARVRWDGGWANHLEEHGLLGDVGGVCVDVLVALPLLGHVDDPLAQRRGLQMHDAIHECVSMREGCERTRVCERRRADEER